MSKKLTVFGPREFATVDFGASLSTLTAQLDLLKDQKICRYVVLKELEEELAKWYIVPIKALQTRVAVPFLTASNTLDDDELKVRLRELILKTLRKSREAGVISISAVGEPDSWAEEHPDWIVALYQDAPVAICKRQRGIDSIAEIKRVVFTSDYFPPHRARSKVMLSQYYVDDDQGIVPEAGRSEPPPIYPSIDPQPEHVVQKCKFHVSVSLQPIPSEATPGQVNLPSGPHTLDVHLLLHDRSAWDTLTWIPDKGTTKAAVFDFIAPRIIPREDGSLPDRVVMTLVTNFYLNKRWCGEGRRNIEVLVHDQINPAADIPPPNPGMWQEVLNIDPGAEPPDLLVRIQSEGGDVYSWTILSPHLDFLPSNGHRNRTTVRDGTYRFVRDNFDRISAAKLTDASIATIEERCRSIYNSTSESFKNAYWELYFAAEKAARQPTDHFIPPKIESIQFISDEPFVPWELMLVRDLILAPKVKEEILSIRHSVGRWIARTSGPLRQNIQVMEMAVFASDYKCVANVSPKLDWAIKEQKFLVSQYGAQPYDLRLDPLRNFLENGTAQAIHFSCHGEMNVQIPALSTLLLEDSNNFDLGQVARDAVRNGEGRQHPIVFLNACQLGGAGLELGLVTGWPQTFLEAGASACIAPLWSIVDESAQEAAKMFYQAVIDEHKTLGQALQEIRGQWRQRHNLTFLSYLLYGDPTARISWHKPDNVPA
jgi:hypothetical protein